MRTLVAGYWAGEFGWELMCWQAKLRAMVTRYGRVVIGCEAGHEPIYQDFADEFLVHHGLITKRNMWLCNQRVPEISRDVVAGYDGDYLAPTKPFCQGDQLQEFIRYGERNLIAPADRYEVLIHARSTENYDTAYRNYPIEKWAEVVSGSHPARMASVGSVAGAWHIKGTDDLRGIHMKCLMDHMAAADVVVGPSSGPIHLASLCGTPHLVWSKEKREVVGTGNKERYTRLWNPLKTQCVFIESQHPDPEEVLACLSQLL